MSTLVKQSVAECSTANNKYKGWVLERRSQSQPDDYDVPKLIQNRALSLPNDLICLIKQIGQIKFLGKS